VDGLEGLGDKQLIQSALRGDLELAARYGSAVELRVEAFSFRAVGAAAHGRLVLRNSGPERIGPLASGQPLVGSLLNASLP
jgi:hypothetical protein